MKSREALKTICRKCERFKAFNVHTLCPFRSISNDYCDEYDQIEKDLEVLEIIKNKLVYPMALISLSCEVYNVLLEKDLQVTQEEYNKIKEYFKNDK